MSDLLIKGMEMPTEEEISKCIMVRHDGEVWIVEFDSLVNECGYVACYPTNPMRAVQIPSPHGALKDADVLEDALWAQRRQYQMFDDTQTADKIMHGLYRAEQIIKETPTIIPESK